MTPGSSFGRLAAVVLVLTLVLAPLPGAPAQAPEGDLQLKVPATLRSEQVRWIQEGGDRIEVAHERLNLTDAEGQVVVELVNASVRAHQAHRWRPVVDALTRLHGFLRFVEVDRAAAGSDAPHEVYLDLTARDFQRSFNASRDLRDRIASATDDVETARGLEVLYLASELLVDGNEGLRQHPQFRQAVQASGNRTSGTILQSLVVTAAGPQASYRYGRALVNASLLVDRADDGTAVNASRLEEAWHAMQGNLAGRSASNPQEDALLQSLNSTIQEEEWLVTIALAKAFVEMDEGNELNRLVDRGNLDQAALESRLSDQTDDLSPLADTVDAGYWGVLQKDAIKGGFALLNRDDTRVPDLVGAVARLEAVREADAALVMLATTGEDGEPPGGGLELSPTWIAAGAAVAGALVGAGAVALYMRGREGA